MHNKDEFFARWQGLRAPTYRSELVLAQKFTPICRHRQAARDRGEAKRRRGERARNPKRWQKPKEKMMAKEKKISAAKQQIIANYEEQKQRYLEEGYEEKSEVISVLKANVMAFVTAGPFVILGVLLWILAKRHGTITGHIYDSILFLLLFLLTVFIHEVLHGVGWSLSTKKKWKSIYLGMMWEYLTPYCHCKEPLTPRQYLIGGLMPFAVLGIGLYVVAFITGSHMLLALGLLNILCAGGDTTIACMLFKYLKQNGNCYILDHPTECGFVAFIKEEK